MSGDGAGIIAVPLVLCVAAPVVVTGLAIAGTVVAIAGAVKLGSTIFQAHQANKLKAAQKLRDSGVEEDIVNLYHALVQESNVIADTYNAQTIRIIDDVNERRAKWHQMLQDGNLEHQIEFHSQFAALSQEAAAYERQRADALRADLTALTNAKDREFRQALAMANSRLEARIRTMKAAAAAKGEVSANLAKQHQVSAQQLLEVLMRAYDGERFCPQDIKSAQRLLEKGNAMLATAPEAAYALFWDAIETSLLAMNKAEQAYQEWLMEYRTARMLAEEIRAIIRQETKLGYLVGDHYAQTMEEAQKFCQDQDVSEDQIRELNADDYVYGELKELIREFEACYRHLTEQDGKQCTTKELYEIIDDLNVKYGANLRDLLFEAKMNVNDALLIDRLEKELSDALHGSYHHSGSARGGALHNGDKHILFTRDGDPEDQICVVLSNGGWDNGSAVTNVDVHVIRDKKVNEKKRSAIRNRIAAYLGGRIQGSRTTLHCTTGTERNLVTTHPAAGDLPQVKNTPVKRKRRRTTG